MPVLLRGRPGVDVYDEGALQGPGAIEFNFVGAGVTAAYAAATRRATVTIPGFTGGTIGDTVIDDQLAVGPGATIQANIYAWIGLNGAGVDSRAGVVVDMGGASAPAANAVSGVLGRGVARDNATTQAFGLDYLAGCSNAGTTLTLAVAVRGQITVTSGTITAGADFRARTAIAVGTLTSHYGFYCEALTGGANRYPFYDAGTVASGNTRGNVFTSNTQLFKTTLDFGGGAGVLGIGVATTAPTTNPTGGVILYVDPADNTLKVRGSAGTVTPLAGP